jgi:hypothetical protein
VSVCVMCVCVCGVCVCVCVCVCGVSVSVSVSVCVCIPFPTIYRFSLTYCRQFHWRAPQHRMSQFRTTCTNNMADARNYDVERL